MRDAIFQDRVDAGRQLADAVMREVGHPLPLVLALPRGGVPVGFEVARGLDAECDVFVVRKLSVPGKEERTSALLLRPTDLPGGARAVRPRQRMVRRVSEGDGRRGPRVGGQRSAAVRRPMSLRLQCGDAPA